MLDELAFIAIWETATEAVHERFGWKAAVAVALAPIAILALIIWLLVIWLNG